jgi:hypothetical protein
VSKKTTETPHSETHDDKLHKSIIQPIMDDLKGQTRLPAEDEVGAPEPAGPGHPPQPAELDQDPGGGYNPDGTYPQT